MESRLTRLDDLTSAAPVGTWLRQDTNGWQLGISTRSASLAVFSAIMGFGFTLLAIYLLTLQPAAWHVSAARFIVPPIFFLCGFFILSQSAMYWRGNVILEVRSNKARLFTGIGRVGRTRIFRWCDIDQIQIVETHGEGAVGHLLLNGKTQIRLSHLIDERFHPFVTKVVEVALASPQSDQLTI